MFNSFEHPSTAAHQNREWNHDNVFKNRHNIKKQ